LNASKPALCLTLVNPMSPQPYCNVRGEAGRFVGGRGSQDRPDRDDGDKRTLIRSEESDQLMIARSRVGTVLRGKYRLDRLLGIGGMACVYAATHLRNADRVAVKILHRELAIDGGLRARFLREGDAANRVGHPGTVRALDDDVAEDGSVFMVMDLLDGETLHQRWKQRGRRLGAREVVRLICEVLDVLSSAHARGIVHRDLKPENLFLTRDGKVKVLDFGLARPREGSPTDTRTGTVFGTPAFMAPEQALGKTSEVDAQSDLWAVGATTLLLLTGRLVHPAKTTEETLRLASTQPAPPMGSVDQGVPAAIARVVDRALAFHKADRWASARAMRDALIRAGCFVWGCDESQHLDDPDDTDEEKTEPGPPAEMTLRADVVPPMLSYGDECPREAPTLRTPSTLTDIESWSRSGGLLHQFHFVSVVVCAIGIAIAVAVIVMVPTSSKHRARAASDHSTTSLP
jgi:serine/threonine protein kinase